MKFASSPRSTLGVEWELVLVDPATGLPVNRAPEIFAALGGPTDHPKLRHEYLQNTVEVVTGICDSVAGAQADLSATLAEVHAVFPHDEVALTSMGLHPWAQWRDVAISDSARYQRLASHVGWWGRQLLIYGVHTHVGVDDERKVPAIMSAILSYYGQLQVLSAASPFWNGENTGYASNRSMLFRQLPSSGLPPACASWTELADTMERMVSAGLVREPNELRWDVRPAPALGTVELRICDGVPTLAEVLALTAVAQCIVEYASALLDAGEATPSLPNWLVAENKWRAARFGMDAVLITDVSGGHLRADEAIAAMLDQLEPVAAGLGCSANLRDARRVLTAQPSYQRQLAVAQSCAHAGHPVGDPLRDPLAQVIKALVAEHRAGAPWADELAPG